MYYCTSMKLALGLSTKDDGLSQDDGIALGTPPATVYRYALVEDEFHTS